MQKLALSSAASYAYADQTKTGKRTTLTTRTIITKTVITLLLSLCIIVNTAAQSTPATDVYADAALGSQDILSGEQVTLVIRVSGIQPNNRPVAPEIKGVALNYVRTQTQIDAQRRLGYAYVFRLTPLTPGSYTIPPIHIPTAKGALKTAAIPFTVHPIEKLTSYPIANHQEQIKAAWYPAKTSLYQGEQCRLYLKLYIPETVNIVNWSFPETTKVNCLAWRFASPSDHSTSQVSLNNTTHKVVTYSTTLSGIQPGTATLGPSKLELYHRTAVISPTRGFITKDTPIEIPLPTLNFNIIPLPGGAPAHFNGAVGNFEIDAYTEKTTFTAADPTEVILRIGGTGNLTTIKSPVLTNDHWKIIDTSKVTRGEERRSIHGIVTFRQIIKLQNQSKPGTQNIPPYTFSYFDPEQKIYQTKTTAPIPITILPSPTSTGTTSIAPEKLGTPPEEMRTILGFIDRPSTKKSKFNTQNIKLWHIIPAAIALIILLPLIRKKISTARTKHPDTDKKNAALTKIAQDSDTRTFYRRAGRFIELWLTMNPELEKIIQERDTICFTPENQEVAAVTKERRAEIITLLKRCSKLTLILLLTLTLLPEVTAQDTSTSAPSRTAEDAWKSGNYQEAIDLYRSTYPEPANTPADILFNIGNSHHRLHQPGHAALAWRQALVIDPTHQKARQNLRFVEIENNALVPKHQPWQRHLLHLPPHIYQLLYHTALWLTGLTVLTLIVRRPNSLSLITCITILVLSPPLAILAKLATHHYPDDHRFAPIAAQAVIIKEAPLYEHAHRTPTAQLKLPPTSLIKINATRGPWSYITTTDDQNGWLHTKNISPLIP